MSFKASNFKRILAILVTLVMCFGTTLTVSAAEEVPVGDESVVENEDTALMPASIGIELERAYKYFTGSITIDIYNNSGNFDADFSVLISGNSSASYRVVMTAADGSTKSQTLCGNGIPIYINMGYAKAGKYSFYIYQLTGSMIQVYGEVKMYD